MAYIGVDIGGTKCAVCAGEDPLHLCFRVSFPTRTELGPEQALRRIEAEIACAIPAACGVRAIGVSCGGPLDSRTGEILSPPNLPGWDRVPIVRRLSERFGVPVRLCNDADACAVAEWKYGAGVGVENMIFLTFGTGLGAGLILNGRLYTGACGMAGEAGHIRLRPAGHTGYGKAGSFEGCCSGGGIAQYGLGSAKELAGRAAAGDPEALAVFREVGENLGRGLAVLIDLLNPEVIVIGSIYARCRAFIEPSMNEMLRTEALPQPLAAVRILPAGLGEDLGNAAALAVAMGGF